MPAKRGGGLFWMGVADDGLDGPDGPVEAVARCLAEAGIEVSPWTPRSCGAGVLLFASVSDGLRSLLRDASRNGPVLAMHAGPGSPTPDEAWALLAAGAADVVSWRPGPTAGRQVVARLERWRTIDELVDAPVVRDNLVGRSPRWRALLRQVVETAHFTDNSVLVTGETGTGKELVARLIHALDRRPDKADLVVLDCTTIVPTLSGSEFFGHEQGSFTGAVATREGAFGLADRGTLFLDEVGELPMTLQAELLRVVQEGTYKRVGANTWRKTSFRLVCATNRDPDAQVREGRFRPDLYYRIAASRFHLPALRERPADILPLAEHFLAELLPGHPPPHFDDAVQGLLHARSYAGNVRELRQLVARLAARHAGPGPITVGDVPPSERPSGTDGRDETLAAAVRVAMARGATLDQLKEAVRDEMIELTIAEESVNGRSGQLRRAASRLGVSVRTLQLWQKARDGRGISPVSIADPNGPSARASASGEPAAVHEPSPNPADPPGSRHAPQRQPE